ncbi:SusC/RagA family TonB-linked outer membrane protein [Butyricimonas sp. Marseille-P3923]|uniref:SusC/RagA family TonB-linked outer membrane protein n=1 Tax=Butyricimonas sp. Marseille-P3923 TaxID=1987504 RepID=UPI000C079FF5|nr:SusC/RagA family TonB-linked outer membrane protein [Butyricimonas sp. Marseille-P3923]
MKKNGNGVFSGMQRFEKMRFIFKRSLLLLFISLFFLQVEAKSQVVRLTINLVNVTIDQAIMDVSQKTGYRFLYQIEEVAKYGKRDLKVTDATLDETLKLLLKDTPLSYVIQNDVVIITPAKDEKVEKKSRLINGKVIDGKGEPLPGVTILIKGTKLGMVTDIDGKFKVEIPQMDSTILVFSFIGMETIHYRLSNDRKNDGKELVITMKEDVEEMDEVVVTGYGNIRKESFTGSSVSVKREDLLKASSTNVIQALSSFDPSFRIQQSNKWGSDPNAIPEIYIRGRSGIGVKELDKDALSKSSLKNNPNLPVFIMDGFEVSVQKVYDMDPMRVENIQILKDAAATAMYGSRAANGVVVITTVAPKPGEVTISYSLTGTVSMPDLSDYNLASAREKLEIETKAGIYTTKYYMTWRQALNAYNERLLRVQEGVNTDWLSLPLRNALNHKHSLSIEGGNADLRYGLDLAYNNNNGVMKDSYRNTVNLGFHVDYRLKNLQVVNYIEYNYMKANESPYGDFSDYAHLQPYDRPYDKNGDIIKGKLDFSKRTHSETQLNNPLYEALLANFDIEKGDVFIERLMAQWYLTDYFYLKGQFAITKELNKRERFIDPLSSNVSATGEDSALAGDLYLTKGESTNWDMQVGAYFSKVFGGHAVNASAVMNATSRFSETTSSHYRGFPSGEYHSPNYAAEIYVKPNKNQGESRLAGFLLMANYTWNDIYLADVSARFDGSSEFGSDQKWAPFWSFGAGVNVHNYSFWRSSKIINRLKLRASYGQTGKVNFPSYSAKTVYKTFDRWYIGGFGVALRALGNRDLKWETTNKLNVGADMEFWNSRISLVFDYYHNKTVDLITDVTLPGSAGFSSYKSNLGETLNEGIDIQFRFNIVQNKDWQVALWGNLNHNTNKILKVSDALKAYNSQVNEYYQAAEEDQTSSADWIAEGKTYKDFIKPVMKYEEGSSLTAIYGVRSLGIDPTNGKELYQYRNGKVSNVWKATEEVVLGDTEPKASGSFGINATYKNFSLFASFAYEWGKQTYNETLVMNVENADIQGSNVDKRVLTQRWEKPGDITPLKDIQDMDHVTLPTSRFVQDENVLSLSALTVSYDFNSAWLRKIYLKTLRLEASTNELFRLSTVKQERGTSYPFARSVNFSLRATF